MSTEAEELLGELVKKIEGLEVKILAISDENKELHDMIKCLYEQNYKIVKESKLLKNKKNEKRSGKDESSNNK